MRIPYLIAMALASLLLVTLPLNSHAQNVKSEKSETAKAVAKETVKTADVKPPKLGPKPKPSALYMELLTLKSPAQKPKAPASYVQNSQSKAQKTESSDEKTESSSPKQQPSKASVKVRPSNHMLGLTLIDEKKKKQHAAEVKKLDALLKEQQKLKAKTKTKTKTKNKSQTSVKRRQPARQTPAIKPANKHSPLLTWLIPAFPIFMDLVDASLPTA